MACVIDVAIDPTCPIETGSELTVKVLATFDALVECTMIGCEACWQTYGRGEKDGRRVFSGGVGPRERGRRTRNGW